VVTKDVPDDALALERSEQTVKPGWAQRFREMKLGRRQR
jgi:bifunctional UDP-N-acetylglucosamine pyrophosphorylase/glucosamine-1-phosphate N-acetyltransferase